MGHIEDRLRRLRLALPPEIQPPPGVVHPFAFVNIRDDRAVISGHGPQAIDGSSAPPFGQVGDEVSIRSVNR
jgi:hypothetical protein